MRALLIVREGDAAAFALGLASGADALLADSAAAAAWRGQGPALYLRVRPLDDPLALDDLAEAVRLRPAGVAMASASGGADVQRLGARLAVAEARQGLADGAVRILAFATQTPEAVLGLPSYRGASDRLAGLVVTRAALAESLRAAPDSRPVRLARDLALLAARAAGVIALDAPFDGLAGLRAEARAARADGFDGMAALSLAQVPVIQAAFAP